MGTRLRNVKKSIPGISGKGKLTDVLIKELTLYYGKAIRSSNSVEEMKNNIWATFYHKCSTDEKEQHDLCPHGQDSWCTWQKAKYDGSLKDYKHKPALHAEVQKTIKPVYEALSDEELLSKCMGHYTQNANESFHSVLWKIAPKESFTGIDIVEIAAYAATLLFNDGLIRLLDIMSALQLEVGPRAFAMCQTRDEERLLEADKRSLASTKEARTEKNRRSAIAIQMEADLEKSFYSAGNF